MKIIPGQKITSVTAGSSNANYPASNLTDENPKRIWKAASGVYSTTLSFTLSGPSSAIALFNTNAMTITATVTDPNYFTWFASDIVWDSGDIAWVAEDASLSNELYNLDGVSGAAWIEWPTSQIPVEAVLTLTSSSTEDVFAGVAVGDDIYEFECPQIGVSEGMRSYSIVKELQNGAIYRKQRDTVRTFSFNFLEDRPVLQGETTSDFYTFMYAIAKELDYKPAAWQLTELDDFWWVVYARFQQMPTGTHSLPDYSRINVSLIEVL